MSIKNIKDSITPIALFSLVILITIFKMSETDIWFHMKAGEVISKTGTFLYKDIFSYTIPGQDWLYHEWLFGVVAYKIYSLFGINGLILGKVILLTGVFIIVYKNMRLRDIDPSLASFLILIGAMAARSRFTERPHIFKFLFIVSIIYLLDLYKLKGKNRLWFIPVLQIIWTNIHGSFILGPVIIAIYLFAEFLSGRNKDYIYLSVIFVTASLVTLINPYGIKLVEFSLNFTDKSLIKTIVEWKPTRLKDFNGGFGFLFAIGIISLFVRIIYQYFPFSKPKRVEIKAIVLRDIAIFCLFAYLSLKAVRFTGLFSIATLTITGWNMQFLISKIIDLPYKKYLGTALGFSILIFVGITELKKEEIPLVFGLGFDPNPPERAVRFMKANKMDGNLYNSYDFGGYLIWSMYPDKKVFIDGRAELYEGVNLLNNMDKALNKYDINLAFLSYPRKVDPIAELQITNNRSWILIYWDDVSRIYIKDLPRNKEIIARYGHKVFTDPISFNVNTINNALKSGLGNQLELELKRDIAANDENVIAYFWLGLLYNNANWKKEAIATWEAAVKISPDPDILNNLGKLYFETNNYPKAIESYLKAIASNKKFILSYYNLGMVYESAGDKIKAVSAYNKFLNLADQKYGEEIKQANRRLEALKK